MSDPQLGVRTRRPNSAPSMGDAAASCRGVASSKSWRMSAWSVGRCDRVACCHVEAEGNGHTGNIASSSGRIIVVDSPASYAYHLVHVQICTRARVRACVRAKCPLKESCPRGDKGQWTDNGRAVNSVGTSMHGNICMRTSCVRACTRIWCTLSPSHGLAMILKCGARLPETAGADTSIDPLMQLFSRRSWRDTRAVYVRLCNMKGV